MLILVEGADGAGKSTLVEKLKERYITISIPKYFECVYKNLEYDLWDYVCDRSFITDLVYRMCDDNERGNLNLYEMVDILKHCKIVYCKTSDMFESSIKRGEYNIVNKSDSDDISKTYDKTIKAIEKFTGVDVLHYDWKTDDVSDVIKFIQGGK